MSLLVIYRLFALSQAPLLPKRWTCLIRRGDRQSCIRPEVGRRKTPHSLQLPSPIAGPSLKLCCLWGASQHDSVSRQGCAPNQRPPRNLSFTMIDSESALTREQIRIMHPPPQCQLGIPPPLHHSQFSLEKLGRMWGFQPLFSLDYSD
jgi:hypothetical protein